jgi:hypothetical protein
MSGSGFDGNPDWVRERHLLETERLRLWGC